MAVGRITGPLLASNLLRDGVNLAVETNLLYLDVTTGRIGIKTNSPQYDLDVNGTANVGSLIVLNTSTLGLLTITKTASSGTIGSTLGPIHIKPAIGNEIKLDADTTVDGDLHATGNITADGNIVLGNQLGVDTLTVGAEFLSSLIPKTPNTYNVGSQTNNWKNGYFQQVQAGNLKAYGSTITNLLASQGIDIAPKGGPLNVRGEIRVWGQNPLGTAPVTSNVLYVNEDGSDTNDGGAMDPSRACRTVSGATKSPLYKEGTSIKVAPGLYRENNPILMKQYTSVIGSDLRTTLIEPMNKTQDLFHVQSGCYVAQLMMYNGRSGRFPGGPGYAPGTNRGAYATAFPPQVNGTKIDLFHSPYIQNCTNQSGPWLYDGTMFVPNQTIQIPEAVGTATYPSNTTTFTVTLSTGSVYVGQSINGGPPSPGFQNARTLLLANKAFIQEQTIAYVNQTYGGPFQYNSTKCARDTGLIVDGLGLDLIYQGTSQSVFSGLQYWSQGSYTGQIASEVTTTTNAFNYISGLAQQIVRNIVIAAPYQNTLTQVTNLPAGAVIDATRVGSLFTTVTNIITYGPAGITDKIIPNGTTITSNTSTVAAYNLLQANKNFLKSETIAWINVFSPGSFVYDKDKCKRDVGYIIDCISFDLLRGGNRQAIQAGTVYYGYSNTTTIPNEIEQTTMAYQYMKSVISAVVQSQQLVSFYQSEVTQVLDSVNPGSAAAATTISSNIDLITRLITVGPAGAPSLVPISLTQTSTAGLLNAYALLNANKNFIKAEVIAYTNSLPNFVYNQEKCKRDVGIILENVSFDALVGGNAKAIESGLAYFNGVNSVIAGQETQSVGAINYVKSLTNSIITNMQAPNLLGSTATQQQVINYSFPGGIVAQDSLNNAYDTITTIITNGPSSAPTSFLGSAPDPHYMSAEILLQANRSFIQEEVVTYLNQQFLTFPFNTAKCQRDGGLIVDSIALDLLFPTATDSQSNFAGLQYWSQSSYTGLIASEITTTTNSITYLNSLAQKIILNDTSGPRYQSASIQDTTVAPSTAEVASSIGTNFDLILDILNNGTVGITDKIIPSGLATNDPRVVHAYTQLQNNKSYIQDEVVAYVESTKTADFVYDQTKCRRDVGYMIDSISFDCLYGGNRQSIMAGVDYYSHSAVTSVQTPAETTATIAAYTHLSDIIVGIITATPIARTANNLIDQVIDLPPATSAEVTSARAKIAKISNIITNGPSVASALTPISLTPSTNENIQRAYALLEANRDFIANEMVQYAQNTYNGGGFQYNQAKCSRDTGLLVDGFITDLGWSANGYTNTRFAGLQYWNQSGYTGQIVNELTTTTAAINYVKTMAKEAIVNTVGTRYQSTITQQINLPSATLSEASTIDTEFKIITDILTTGTVGITDKVVSNGLAITSANAQNAYNILQANKAYFQAEAIAFVETTKTQSFVYNQDKCFRDTGLIVDTICQDLMFATTSSQSTFAGLQYWAQTSTSIPGEVTTTTNAINYVSDLAQKIIVGNKSGTRYQSAVAQTTSTSLAYGTAVEQSTLSSEFNLITDIITNGVVNLTNRIVPNGYVSSTVATTLNAYNLLVANLTYLQAEAVAYVESTKTAGFTYDQTKCRRDIGYMVTSVAFDLLWGGNKQAIQSGAYYYNYSASTSTIPTEKPQTLAAYNYLKTLVGNIVTNTAITPSKGNTAIQYTNAEPATVAEVTALQASISTITNIITNGPSVAATKLPISLTPSTNIAVGNAVDLLQANRQFIQQELVAWINENYGDFTYDLAKCKRDVGYMIDSVSYDLLWGGNRQAITSGVYYYSFSGPSSIPGENQQTLAAYQRMSEILGDIITNSPIQVSSGNVTPQQFNNSPSTIETASALNAMVALLLDIINNGPTAAGTKQPISLERNTDQNIVNAQTLLTLNRQFIRDEVIAYVNSSFPNYQGNNGFNYDQSKCYRDTGLIIDAISQDLLVGGNRKTIEAGVSYWTGGRNVVYDELPQFNAALTYIKDLSRQIVQNQTVTALGNAPQTINTYFGGGIYAIDSINRLIDTFTTIVTKGPAFSPIGYEGAGTFSALSPTSADYTQVASTVLQADQVGVNEYQITLNVPTQGPGINQTIYFGQTSVYPLQDKDVPDIYSDRKVDPWGSIGGSLVDGGVISDRSPIQSFVYDAFTQVNQGGIGIHITNNGYAQLVSVFTIFCGTSVLVENGGICSITNSNANFGDYCLVSKGYGKRSFFGEITNPAVLPYYPNGFFPQNQQVEVYCPDPADRPHIGQVMEVEVPETYRNAQGLPGYLSAIVNTSTLTAGSISIDGIDTTGVVIGQSIYARDQFGSYNDLFGNRYITEGTVVTDVNFLSISLSSPINAGGGDVANANFFTMYVTGNAYYTIRGSTLAPDPFTPGTKLIGASRTEQGNDQTIEEIQAITYLSSLTNSVVTNKLINAFQSTITQFTNIALATGGQSTVRMGQLFTTLETIINNGPSSAPTVARTGIVAPGASDSSSLLRSNKLFLQTEIVNYINSLYFVYDHATCKRDLGYILDSFAYDVAFQSNYQAIKSGQAYNRNVAGSKYVLENEKTQTTDAISRLGAITNQLAGVSTVTSAISVINLDAIYIQNIINNGDGAGPAYSMPAPAGLDAGIVGAISLINNNIQFITEELIGWINYTYPVFTYDAVKCKRDMGYILDAVHWDVLLGTNYRAVKAGQAYYLGNAGNVLTYEKSATIAAFNFIKTNALLLPAVTVSTVATTTLNTDIATINDILQNGVSVSPTVTYTLPSNIASGFDSASLLLQNNIAFIQAEVEAYVYTTYTAGGFIYDRTKCKRDVGYLMQALIYDITYGGNSMSVDAALQYFDNSNNNVSTIPNEETQTVAAINYINTICQRIIVNLSPLVSYQTVGIITQYKNSSYINGANAGSTVALLITEMSNIVGNGPGSAPIITTPSITWVNATTRAAGIAINANANSIATQAITFIGQNFDVFTYDQTACRRDIGYILQALIYDLTYGGNWQTVDSGRLYWNGTTSLIPNEQKQTIGAWNRMLYLLGQIIQNQNPANSYQATYSQFTNGSITTGVNALPALTNSIGILTSIIQNGLSYAPAIVYPNITQASSVLQGIYNIIQTQKTSLVNQVITYIDGKYNGFEYNQALCKRDVGYIIDAVAADLVSGGNYNTVLAGQSYYARAGTHHYVELEDNITDAGLFSDKALVNFYQRSYMSASGYLFEYVGAGSNYGALPQIGRADPIQERETIQLNNGKVFFTSTDQNGDFRIGPGLVISQATGVLSGRTFTKSLFANLTPFILAIEGI